MSDSENLKLREDMLPSANDEVLYFDEFYNDKNYNQKQNLYYLWLSHALGFGANCLQLICDYPNVEDIFKIRFDDDLLNYVTQTQLDIMRAKEPEDFLSRIRTCDKLNIKIATFSDKDYPKSLRNISAPPLVLYYRGDLSLINKCFTFAFIGSRRPSAYGVEITSLFSKELAKAGMLLVSGMASGLDSECHKASLQNNTPTVACIAFGHDLCYPAQNKRLMQLIENNGVVVGEYPPGTAALKPHFLQRNRLIAGISHGICVAEARKASGTMNTIGFALEYGKEVFGVPGSVFSPLSEGTHNMIKEGARIASCSADILEWACELLDIDINIKSSRKKRKKLIPKFTGIKQKVYSTLTSKAQSIEQICDITGLTLPEVISILTELELEGYAQQQAGRQFLIHY